MGRPPRRAVGWVLLRTQQGLLGLVRAHRPLPHRVRCKWGTDLGLSADTSVGCTKAHPLGLFWVPGSAEPSLTL